MTKDPGFSHLVKKGDRAMLVTGVVLVAIMGAIVHSMLSGLTPMQSLLTPGATVVQAQSDSPKTNSSTDNSEDSNNSESQAGSQPEPKKQEKTEPKPSSQRATNQSAPRPAAPVKPPAVQKPRNLINDVIKTADGLVEAILPIEVCVKLLAATC
jgi:hypothetical protein